jgi:dolichol-phosphate mannosyltransferase
MSVASLSLILPTLNERENIQRLIPELLAEIPSIRELWVVDDDSQDGTPEAVERLALVDPRIRLLRRKKKEPCLTDAIQCGISASGCDLVGWMDADLAISGQDFQRLVDAVLAGADVAIASRFVRGGRIKGQDRDGVAGRLLALRNLGTTEDTRLGVFLSWALNAVVLPSLVGAGVKDYTSGIVVGKRETLSDIRLRGHHGEYFIHLWASLLAGSVDVLEIPYQVQPRRFGESKTGSDLRRYLARGTRYIAAGMGAGGMLRAARGGRAERSGTSGAVSPARAASPSAKRASR